MSDTKETKHETAKRIHKTFKELSEKADTLHKEAGKIGDAGLSTKIQKVKEAGKEVVKHIEERMDPQRNS